VIATNPALWLLARRKFRGVFRKQLRRVKTLKGAMFAFFGLAVFGVWIASIVLPQFARSVSSAPDPVVFTAGAAQVGLFMLVVFTMLASIGYRGLYMPKDEVELLFSAPVSRSDVIRYRLLTNVGRSIFGGLVVGLFAVRSAPVGLYGFAGTFVAVQSLPLLSQGISLLLGGAENRLASSVPKRLGTIGGILAALVYIAILIFLLTNSQKRVTRFVEGTDFGRALAEVVEHPWVLAVSSPCHPWARMITATTLGEFVGWLAVSLAGWVAVFELVARIPVDYRELSLQTAADLAKRIQRARRAGGASASSVSRTASGWTVPWLFGHGRFGAIAWLKTVSIVRKARGTLVVSLVIVSLLTVGATAVGMARRGAEAEIPASIGVVFIGCLYLCGGLRFDFREDLDRMEFVKTCPARAWVVFFATLTPQVMLVSALIALALVVKSAILGQFHPVNWALLPAIPLLTMTWTSIDNIVFLAAPVRYVAGQDTVLQNAGRTVVLMFVRVAILTAVMATLAIPIGLSALTAHFVPMAARPAVAVGAAVALVVWLVDCAALVAAGAWQLRRFDVSRDRP
jgi:hypothetical protein